MLYTLLFVIFAGCFLLGMTWMRIGLLNISGNKMDNWLRKATGSPVKGLMIGIIMTVALQSSSAVTVIAVGLVSARILSFPQTIGIILGTNIGTTITLQFFTFDLSIVILPLLMIGVCLQFFKSRKIKSSGFVFLGIGIIFSAMNGFEWLSTPLGDVDFVQKSLQAMGNSIVLAFFIGTILTAIMQSSTVMTGIAMSFLSTGTFPIETGIAIMLGANIGTCGTALLASVGAGHEARLTAYAHLWLNLAGCILFIPLIKYLAEFSASLSSSPDVQLAHSSVIFNIVCSLLVLPFANQFGRFIMHVHGKDKM